MTFAVADGAADMCGDRYRIGGSSVTPLGFPRRRRFSGIPITAAAG